MSAVLEEIGEKVAAGRALADEDAKRLAEATDIVTLGMIADGVRRRRHGARTTFVRVAQVSVTDATAGTAAWPEAAREVRLGGAFPGIDEASAAVRAVAAAGVPVTGFSLHELVEAAGGDRAALSDWLGRLKAEGLAAIAAAAIDRVADFEIGLEPLSEAGIRVGAWVVETGGGDDPLAVVRAIQQVSRVYDVRVFAPVPRRSGPAPTTGYADVKAVALARILLNVPHIQVDWGLHGPKLAQVALTFGADDIDNVSPLEETAEGRRRAPLEEIRRNIRAAALEPVERDGRFDAVA